MLSSSHLLLAGYFSEISRSSSNYGSGQYYIILSSVFTAFAILWVILYIFEKNKKTVTIAKRKVRIPLLTQLCRVHRLSSNQCTLLKTMTDRAGLQPPEVVFVDPTLWPYCIEKSPHNRKPLLEIMEILFGAERVEQWNQSSSDEEDAQSLPETV